MKRYLRVAVLTIVGVSSPLFGLESDFNKGLTYQSPIRERSIIIGKGGFYHKAISMFKGETLKVFLTTATEDPGCFLIPQKKFFLSVSKGEIAEGKVNFDRTGVYQFNCPTGKLKGRITVLEKPGVGRREKDRVPASEQLIRVWRPRER